MRASGRKRLDMIDLESLPARTSRAVLRNEGALTLVSHENFVPHIIRYMSR